MEINNDKIQNLRVDYTLNELSEKDIFENPIRQFHNWFNLAVESNCPEANAMTLSTISEDGNPNSRVVLLKGIEANAFRFYTNYKSQKGIDISNNNRVSLLFFWPNLQKQVRVLGEAYKLEESVSTDYFQSRPLKSQIGAWVSDQSKIIKDRSTLELKTLEIEAKFKGLEILPKPEFWGGYEVRPFKIEFWQGRSSRLHDRIVYTLLDIHDFKWEIKRLSP